MVFGIMLVYMICFLIGVGRSQRRRVFYSPKYYRSKWPILIVGAGIILGIFSCLNLSPREQEKLEMCRFIGSVWAESGTVTPSLDNQRIRGPELGDKPVYAFLHPDSLLNNEEGGRSPKNRPPCKPRSLKKTKGGGKSSLNKR
jgi:hypothetical protein